MLKQPREISFDELNQEFLDTQIEEIQKWEKPIPLADYETPDIPADLLPGVYGTFAKALAQKRQKL